MVYSDDWANSGTQAGQPAHSGAVPVLVVAYNRPDLTRQVLEACRNAGCRELYVAVDGPKPGVPADASRVDRVREIVNGDFAVPSERTLARQENLGCRLGVSSSISWFLEHVDEGIILEDDCLPSAAFFRFCREMLERYRHDPTVMMITGTSFHRVARWPYDYYFSRFPQVWGWATWKRAWNRFDSTMSDWDQVRETNWLEQVCGSSNSANYWQRRLDSAATSDSWAYRWLYSMWRSQGLCLAPQANLISNVGFGDNATHTGVVTWQAAAPTGTVHFPLRHPPQVEVVKRQEDWIEKHQFEVGRGSSRLINALRRGLPPGLRSRLRDIKQGTLRAIRFRGSSG